MRYRIVSRAGAVAMVVAFVSAAPTAGAAGPATVVRPGGLVQWKGAGTEVCRMAGRSWEPLGDVCVYPIDLETPAGPLVVERRRNGVVERASLTVGAYPYATQHLTIADETKVHLSRTDLARVERESSQIAQLWSRLSRPRFSLPLRFPLAAPETGGRFGARRVINGEPRSPHTGVDYSAPQGAQVFAVAGGTVVLTGDFFFSGKSVFVDHGGGLISMYFHLSKVEVAVGDEVTRGAKIGLVGATGRATGPHLHFGLRWLGARIDPGPLFEGLSALPVIAR